MSNTLFADPIIGKLYHIYVYWQNFPIFICATFSRPNYCGASTLYLEATVCTTINPFDKENLCFKKMKDMNFFYFTSLSLGNIL